MQENKTIKLTKPAKFVVRRLREEKEQIYKWTGNPRRIYCAYHKSQNKLSSKVLDELFEKGIVTVYDAAACETWYELTPLGKTININ